MSKKKCSGNDLDCIGEQMRCKEGIAQWMQQNTSSHVISWDDMSMRWKCESCNIGGSRAYGKRFMDSLAKPCSDPVVTAAVPAKAAKRKN